MTFRTKTHFSAKEGYDGAAFVSMDSGRISGLKPSAMISFDLKVTTLEEAQRVAKYLNTHLAEIAISE